jgi:HEAT repeat protein
VGGKLTLIFPCATSTRAFQDPTHRRFIPAMTAYYFNKAWRDANKLNHYNVKCDFDILIGEAVNVNWQTRSAEAKQFAGQNYWNVVDDLHFILTKR